MIGRRYYLMETTSVRVSRQLRGFRGLRGHIRAMTVIALALTVMLAGATAARALTATIGGSIWEGAFNYAAGPVYCPGPASCVPISGATVMVQNQHSGGAVIGYATVAGNGWSADVPCPGDYVVMFSAPDYDLTSREFTAEASCTAPAARVGDGCTTDTDCDLLGGDGTCGSCVVTNPNGTGATQDAYLPPLPLPSAGLLVYAFYDNATNGEPDEPPDDDHLNGVAFTACPEDGPPSACQTGVTGSQTFADMPPGFAGSCMGVGWTCDGLYYFSGLPPGEIIVTSDPSGVYLANNRIRGMDPTLPPPNGLGWDATTEFYLDYTEEGGPAWDPKLYPGDTGMEDGVFLIWHGYVEKLGPDAGCSDDPACTTPATITGYLLDADGNDPEEPMPPGLASVGVSDNKRVPDGLVILFTDDETIRVHPVATAEATAPACEGGPDAGSSCLNDTDCGKECVGGTSPGSSCTADSDCPGGGACDGRCGGAYYEFTDVPPGSYKIMAFDIPLEYVWVQSQLNVGPGQTISGSGDPGDLSPADLWIPRFGARARGYVYDDSTGLPVPGVKVNIRYKSGAIKQEAYTDASGQYWFDFLPEVEVLGHVDVELPPGYRGALETKEFTFNVGWCENALYPGLSSGDYCKISKHCPACQTICSDDLVTPTPCSESSQCNPGATCISPCGETCVECTPGVDCTVVTHNAMNRYIQWYTANYQADLRIEAIPGGEGDIRGVVWNENLATGTWSADGIYDRHEERTLHGVTVELWSTDPTPVLLATTTTGKVDTADLKKQGWAPAYSKPVDEWGGVYAGPLPGFYEFRGLTPGTSYTVTVVPPFGFSGAPAPAPPLSSAVTVSGATGTEHNVGLMTLAPQAGEIEGGVFDDLNVDPRIESLLYLEKAGIDHTPVGVYDHLGYVLGVGFMGNPMCYDIVDTCPTNEPNCCPADEDPLQKPEMERRFAPGVHIYYGNDPAFPGYNPLYESLVLPYTFGQGQYKFEADWSLPPLAFQGTRGIPLVPGPWWIPTRDEPRIDEVEPGGSYVIRGANFEAARGHSTVTLSGRELFVLSWSDTEIHVETFPPDYVSGPLIVTTTSGPSNAVWLDTGVSDSNAVFVDASNTDLEDGSQTSPWNTITEALANLPVLAPGVPRRVFVAAGTYNEHLQIAEDDVHIIGAGPLETTVDGSGPAPFTHQGFGNGGGPVFFIGAGGEAGSVNNILISSFTITGGSVKGGIGAGIFGDYGNTNIDINNCVIVQNGGYYGGGIWLHLSNHDVDIWSNTIAENGNYGGYAGGISVNDEPEYGPEHGEPEHIWDDDNCGSTPPGTYRIFNNHIFNNFSPDYGGAITLYEVKDHLKVYGNLIEDNKADDHGGAMFFEDCGPIDVYQNEFLRNFSRDDGGAISFEDVGDCLSEIKVYNNLFADNIADDCGENHARGGALAFDDAFYARVYNNTIVNNIVAGSFSPAGGGIDSERHGHEYNGGSGPYIAPGYSDVQIFNNIIWGNMRLNYDQPMRGDEEDLCFNWGVNYRWTEENLHVDNPWVSDPWETHLNSESFSLVEYNDISNGEYSSRVGNIDADPLFVDPSSGDYHLTAGSPAVNQALVNGSPVGLCLGGGLYGTACSDDTDCPDSSCGTVPAMDLGGFYRDATDGWIEMGAYEVDGTQDDWGLIWSECGDNTLQIDEECDGTEDGACPGQCQADCICTSVAEVEADTCVLDKEPSTNFGNEPLLQVDGDSAKYSYLRFNVGDYGNMAAAYLRLWVADGRRAESDSGGTVYAMSDSSCSSWHEQTMTWENRPPIDGVPLDTVGEVDRGQQVELDVTAALLALSGNPNVCFAMKSNSSNGVDYNSSETPVPDRVPKLVIMRGGPPPLTAAATTTTTTTSTSTSTSTTTLPTTTTTTAPAPSTTTTVPSSTTTTTLPASWETVCSRVEARDDDAEERASGSVKLGSSDLEMIRERSDQTVGMRFNRLPIPQGAAIQSAYVQFQADETDSEYTSLSVQGEAVDDAAAFASLDGNISSRTTTAAAVGWTPAPWQSAADAGLEQRISDLRPVVQEIVDRPGWRSGNSLVIIVTGEGKRVAESYDGDQDGAPLLCVDYATVGGTPSTTSSTTTSSTTTTTIPPVSESVCLRIEDDDDDGEERASGRVVLGSSDLEMIRERSNQTVGMRFNRVPIPQGAVIQSAYVQFQADETDSEYTSLSIRGEDADNASTFTSTDWDLSSRPTTAATETWTPPTWNNVGEAGPSQRTGEIASIVQDIVNRPGWQGGNSLVILITGQGKRVAESHDGDAAGAPLLCVEYSTE